MTDNYCKQNSLLHTTTTARIRHSSSVTTDSIAKRNMGIFFWSLCTILRFLWFF